MPAFSYKARNSAGKLETGELDATDRAAALQELYDQGLHVSQLDEVAQPVAPTVPAAPGLASVVRRVRLMDRCAFWRQAGQTQAAGMTINKTLDMLGQTRLGPLSSFARDNASNAAQGQPLSRLMLDSGGVFTPLEVGLVRAGEASGRLDDLMRELAVIFEREMEVRNKVRYKLAYLGCVGIVFALVGFVLAVIAPSLMARGMGQPFSLVGRTLQFLLPWAVILGALFAGRMVYATSALTRRSIDRLKVTIPIVGGVFRKLSIARFARSLGYLFNAGVPAGESLEIAAASTGNLFLAHQLRKVPHQVREGAPLSDVMEATGQFPMQVLQMVRTGEETGEVDASLAKVSEYYEGEAIAATNTLVTVGFGAAILLYCAVIGIFVIRFFVGYYGGILGMFD